MKKGESDQRKRKRPKNAKKNIPRLVEENWANICKKKLRSLEKK